MVTYPPLQDKARTGMPHIPRRAGCNFLLKGPYFAS